jgi:hypothetical protein
MKRSALPLVCGRRGRVRLWTASIDATARSKLALV